jgi:hypothetical protein
MSIEHKPLAWIIEQLDMPIRYINAQWAVTGYGIECIASQAYEIPKDRLDEERPGTEGLPDWPLHMAEKEWVDIERFIAAFEQALKHHRVKHSFVADWKERCLEKARWMGSAA